MSQLAEGSLHKYLTGEVVTGDETQVATNLNIVFESIRRAHNDTDVRSKDTYKISETDNKFYNKTQIDTALSAWIPDGHIFNTKSQMYTATEGQTVFTLTEGSYLLGYDRLQVFVDGIKQYVGSGDFLETSATSFTLSESVPVGTKVEATWLEGVLASPADNYQATLPPIPVSLANGLQVLNNKQAAPLDRTTIKGSTLTNLLGRDGNCEDVSKWSASQMSIALDTTNVSSGLNSIKGTMGAFTQGVAFSRNLISGFNLTKLYLLVGDVKNGTATSGGNLQWVATGAVSKASNPITDATKFNTTYATIGAANLTGATALFVYLTITGTNTQTAYFDNVRLYEISSTEKTYIDTLSVAAAQAYIAAKYPYVDDVKHINAPYVIKYGENLFPPLSDWTVGTDANGSYTIADPFSATLTTLAGAGASTQQMYAKVPVVPNQTYTISFNASASYGCAVLDPLGAVVIGWATGTRTFNSGNNTSVTVFLGTTVAGAGTFTFSNPMLNIGATAKTFKPRNDDMLAFQNVQLASSIDGAVYDTLFKRDGKYFVENRFKKDMVLDGSLAWSNSSDSAGFKAVKLAISGSVTYSGSLVKYDGKVISDTTLTGLGAIDRMTVYSDGNLYISIADTDSGFGETYTPTVGEIQAYFYGWKLNNGVFGTPYNGSGTKTWTLWNAANNTGAVTVVPTTLATGFTPYKLTYQLAAPTFEEIQVEGGMSFHEGLNQIELGQALIVREKTVPNFESAPKFYHINVYGAGTPSDNPLKNRTSKILTIFKNGLIDKKWTMASSFAYGKERAYISQADYDPTATYEISYIALDQYAISANVQAVTGETAANLKTTVDTLSTNDADQDARISALEINKARKVQGQWITPTLLNGWVTVASYSARYIKDEFGFIHLGGVISTGTITPGTILFKLPVGYRTLTQRYIGTITNNGSGLVSATLVLYTNGDVGIDNASSSMLFLEGLTFLAEQ